MDPVAGLKELLNTDAGFLVKIRLQAIKDSLEEKALHAARSGSIEEVRLAAGRIDGIDIVLEDFEKIRKGINNAQRKRS